MEKQDALLTASEEKRLRCYYRCAKYAGPTFGAGLMSGVLLLLLVMIHDLLLKDEDHPLIGICGGLAMMAICLVVFICLFAVSACGMSGKKYKAILEKVEVQEKKENSSYLAEGVGGQLAGKLTVSASQSEAGKKTGKAIETASVLLSIFGIFYILYARAETLAEVMEKGRVSIPETRKQARTIVLVTALLVLAVFTPDLADSYQTRQSNRQAASIAWHALYDQFQEAGFAVSGDDPDQISGEDEYCLHVLNGKYGSNRAMIFMSKSGRIASIGYIIDLDIQQEKADSLRKVSDFISAVSQGIAQVERQGELTVAEPRLIAADQPAIREFAEKLEKGTYFDPISVEYREQSFYAHVFLDIEPGDELEGRDSVSLWCNLYDVECT